MVGQSVEIGGQYTKLVWGKINSSGTCNGTPSDYLGDGRDDCGRAREPNWNIPCYYPNECPPSGVVPIFKRYFDDIIVLKRTQ
jgi:hypothetical protein